MILMNALVGFSLPDASAAAGAWFSVESDAAALRLEAAGVAERAKADKPVSATAKPAKA